MNDTTATVITTALAPCPAMDSRKDIDGMPDVPKRVKPLRRRTPEEWREVVDGLDADMDVRVQAACIVWWDYFSRRESAERWPHLDDYFEAWRLDSRPDLDKVEKALVSLGYPEGKARKRCNVKYPPLAVPEENLDISMLIGGEEKVDTWYDDMR